MPGSVLCLFAPNFGTELDPNTILYRSILLHIISLFLLLIIRLTFNLLFKSFKS